MRVDDYCRAVIRSTKLTLAEQAVLWMLGSYVHRETGETFVSLQTIARDIRADYRWVRRAVDKLAGEGIVAVDRRTGRSSIYRLPIHPAVIHNPAPTDPGSVGPGSENPGLTDPHPRAHRPWGSGLPDPTNQVPNQVLNRAPAASADDSEPEDPTPEWFQRRRQTATGTDGPSSLDGIAERWRWQQ